MSATNGTNGVDPELLRVRRESRGCQTCGGDGLTIVFHPRWSGVRVERMWSGEVETDERTGDINHVMAPTAMEVAAHCVCALGQWMRQRVDEDVRRFIPDALAIVAGRSSWLFEPPSHPGVVQAPSRFAHNAPHEAIACMVDGFRVSA